MLTTVISFGSDASSARPLIRVAGLHQINLDRAFFPAEDIDNLAPGRTAQLSSNAFQISRRILSFSFKLEALHVDSFQAVDQILDLGFVRIFAGKKLRRELDQPLVNIHVDRLARFGREGVELTGLNPRILRARVEPAKARTTTASDASLNDVLVSDFITFHSSYLVLVVNQVARICALGFLLSEI